MALNNENNNDCCKCTTPEYEIILGAQGPQGRQGEKGEPGFTPIISVKDNTDSNYTLNILTQDGPITTPNLKANLPAGGATGQVLTKNSANQDDCSWQNLPNATEEVEGIARLATETDFTTTEDSAVSETSIVTPALFNSELKAQVNTFIVAGDNITTSVDDEGKVTINSTGGGVTDAYTKAEANELLDNKQDVLTPVYPLTLQNKIISNLVGFEYTSDGQYIYSDKYLTFGLQGVSFWTTSNFGNVSFGTEWSSSCIPAYIDIPYSIGDIVKVPTPSGINSRNISLGKILANGTYIPIAELPISGSDFSTSDTVKDFNGAKAGWTTKSCLNDYGENFNISNPTPACSYFQVIDNGSSLSMLGYYNYDVGNDKLAGKDVNYIITNPLAITRFKEIQVLRITATPNDGRSSNPYPVNSFGLYRPSETLKTIGDFNNLGENLFDLSGQTAKNYLEVQVDGTTITTNSTGQLQANIPDNLTTQGNTFNGANQLVQLDAAGKLPAIDGSQLTNLPSGNQEIEIMPVNSDFNTFLATGIYFWASPGNSSNNPNINMRGYLQVFRPQENTSFPVVQTYYTCDSNTTNSPEVWIRYCINGSSVGYTWTTWNKVNDNSIPNIVVTSNTNTNLKIWTGTQQEYDTIQTKDPNTIYAIKGA